MVISITFYIFLHINRIIELLRIYYMNLELSKLPTFTATVMTYSSAIHAIYASSSEVVLTLILLHVLFSAIDTSFNALDATSYLHRAEAP